MSVLSGRWSFSYTGLPEIPAACSDASEYDLIDLRDAVDQLDESLRDAVMLYYFRDMPLKKDCRAAGHIGRGVKNRLYRARHILAQRTTNFRTSSNSRCRSNWMEWRKSRMNSEFP
ncbi:RNA polymerase ECF-type sigma factor [Paenibacillus dendritiformis C454]|uniref:RNA polymerase ECF-type sigma factor n=1 Tax=Paenibacillus dendritiformis C454 TaxID=1131935 RepID=H3SJD8_9BACL|nr:RNA polymerase ECF-type sigma factor [Paenibacillus dendritiformis C454]